MSTTDSGKVPGVSPEASNGVDGPAPGRLPQQVIPGVAIPRRASGWWTFLGGMGSCLELFPPPERIGQEQTDAEAFAEDWQAVADDLWAAIGSYELGEPTVKQNPARSSVMPRAQKPPFAVWPPPEMLEAYEKVAPGLAKEMLDDFRKESAHRQAMERESLSARISIARWGQIFGFAIGIAALIAGSFTATQGYEIAGSFIGAGGVVGLVSVFVLGRMKLGETTVEK